MPKDIEQSHIIPPTYRETSEEPGRSPAFRGPRPRWRRTGLFVSLTLVTLAAIVILASLLMHFASRGPLAPGRRYDLQAACLPLCCTHVSGREVGPDDYDRERAERLFR